MQLALTKIANWCRANKLTLNASKTEYVIYGTKIRKSKAPQIRLQIGNTIIQEVAAYKYLGTTLDSTMTATNQLNKLNQTLALKLKTLRKMRCFISENTALLLYKTTILPIIDYNDIIYRLLTQQQETKLQRTQNRALRTVYKGKQLSTQEMHELGKLDTLTVRRDIHLLALMYKRATNPEYVDNTKRKTRTTTGTQLRVPHPKTDKMTRAPVYAGSKLWNTLPQTIRSQATYDKFKIAVRAHLTGQTQPRQQAGTENAD